MLKDCRQELTCLPKNESSDALYEIVDYLGDLFDSCLS